MNFNKNTTQSTYDRILELIMQHLYHTKIIQKTSSDLFHCIEKQQLNLLTHHLENRHRLINILADLQEKIESAISIIPYDNLKEINDIFSSWKREFTFYLLKITDLDHQIIGGIENLKKNTSEEIAIVFKAKEQLKKYNLNNLSTR